MAAARVQAVMRSATVAIRFEDIGTGVTFASFVDGNRNGVRTAEIRTGVDWPLTSPANLSDLFPGATIESRTSDLMSFTPLGTASSGSIYVRAREGTQYAVRVLGATGRARVLRYDPATREWVESY